MYISVFVCFCLSEIRNETDKILRDVRKNIDEMEQQVDDFVSTGDTDYLDSMI